MKFIKTILSGVLSPSLLEMHPKPSIQLAVGQNFIQESFLDTEPLLGVSIKFLASYCLLLFITQDNSWQTIIEPSQYDKSLSLMQ